MSVSISIKALPLTRVTLTEIDGLRGRIVEISVISGQSLQYKIRYYHNGEERASWFQEDEFELI